MKYLVTGGAGFIGSNFCFYLAKEHPDDQIVCIDSLTYAGNLKTLQPLFSNHLFKFIRINICHKNKIDKLFKEQQFDYVVNFAAETHVDRSVLYPDVFVKTNVLGTQNLIDASLKYHIKRFHQVSTDEVYGDLPLDRPNLLFSEISPIKPSSPYSASKAAADFLVLAYHRTFGLNCTISRCSNNYGPYQFPEKLIPLMISNAIHNKDLPIYGNGLNVRDWLHVYDHCTAIDIILGKGQSGEVYNVGGNNEKSNLQIVNLILSQLRKPQTLIKHVADRKGHDLRYAIDSSKLKALGWTPKFKFETGISQTIEWNVKNEQWVEDVKSKEYIKWIKDYYR